MTTTDTPEFYAILTEAGQRLQFECLDNPDKTFEMSEMAVGDGNGSYYEPEKTQTKLKNECYRHAITRRMTDEDNLVKSVILDIPEDVTGFTVREVGVFGTDGELLIIGKYPATERKSTDSGAISQLAIKVDLTQINELVLPVLIDPSVNTASVEYVETYFQKLEEKGQANGYASLDAEGLVPKEQLPVTDYVKFCVNSGAVDEKGEPDILQYTGYEHNETTLGTFYSRVSLAADVEIYSDEYCKTLIGKVSSIDTESNTMTLAEDETIYTCPESEYKGKFTVKAPFVYTTISGKTHEVTTDLTVTVPESTTGKVRIFVDKNEETGYFLEALTNDIYIQKAEPSLPNADDIWVNVSVAPETEYRYISSDWEMSELVEIGSRTAITAGGGVPNEPQI